MVTDNLIEQRNNASRPTGTRIMLIIFCAFLINCTHENPTLSTAENESKAWTLDNFVKVDSLNPILNPSHDLKFKCPVSNTEIQWESRNVLNPAAIVHDTMVYLFYRAQDSSGTSRIGLATSHDGLHFTKHSSPVLFPDNDAMKKYEWNYKKLAKDLPQENCTNCYFDGVEDPRVVMSGDGSYIMTYTAYDGKTARLCVASSTNLLQWEKHGLAFKDKKYSDLWSKAGAIIVERHADQFIAKKVGGKYWMYFGDTDIFLASSDDLINWQICENKESEIKISVLNPRMGYFDSRLVEPGPFALYNEDGILLIYNGSNAANFNDPDLKKFTYSAGQALFDKDRPHKLNDRTEGYFITPDKEYEKIGEVNEVCFVEGLVNFKNSWLLYYGTADSKIAVAKSDSEK